ncbi:Transposase [Cordylochernes scorpioides]|uniref:Transposase n=1 Tax=Cordylochernes scorpioides TaxID=51811 RepID=A0ABY6KNB7_9ARAC|nr:Transposase [Cordylochernes scorpioides]
MCKPEIDIHNGGRSGQGCLTNVVTLLSCLVKENVNVKLFGCSKCLNELCPRPSIASMNLAMKATVPEEKESAPPTLVISLNFVWVHTIETLSEASSDITIILDEFNAKSSIWGSPVQDNKSQQVEDMLTDLDLTPLNNDSFQEKPPKKTTAIFLDMASAFDRVWREKLREKLHNIGVRGKTLIWIADFLRGRRLKVRVKGEFSKEGRTWAGVPQGSVLSPLLYLLYINDIHPYLTEDTKVACYADDIAIWHTSSSIEKSERSYQKTKHSEKAMWNKLGSKTQNSQNKIYHLKKADNGICNTGLGSLKLITKSLISTQQLVEKLDRYPLRNKRKIDSVESEETSMNVKTEAGTQVSNYVVQHLPRNPSIFSGEDGEDLQKWLKGYARVAKYNHWDETLCLTKVYFYLSGTALKWFENNEEIIQTWKEFTSQLENVFGKKENSKLQAEKKLKTRAQLKGESTEFYIQDVLCLCKEVDPQMSEEDKISHLMKGIAEDLYQALLPRDVQSTEEFITECRRVQALRCRRVTPTRYERLPKVASLCDQDDGEDLSSMIRQIVREETYQVLMKKISQLKEDIHRSHLKISLAIVLVLKTDDIMAILGIFGIYWRREGTKMLLRRTISRRLVANGLHSCRPLRRLPLTPPNRRQRLEWCRARSTWMTEWHRVVLSDESRFCLSSDSRRVRVWRRRGERSNPAAIVERPTVRQRGIMVGGAIAYDSRSPLLRIQGTMTAQRYVDDVLRPVTLPYLQGVPNALYQQDNARPHTARISQQALQDVQMLPWPPYSPDLSPIEHVWDIIGRRLHALPQLSPIEHVWDIIGRRLHALPQPRSEDELWKMIEREWRAIPQDAIRTLIDSLPRRVAACIAVRGGPTCY